MQVSGMWISRSRRWLLPLSLAGILAIGGVSGGLDVFAGMAIGIAVGVALVLAYGTQGVVALAESPRDIPELNVTVGVCCLVGV
jgi:hypothetical protein